MTPYGFAQNFTPELLRRLHAAYAGEVTMVDHWLGHFMERFHELGLVDLCLPEELSPERLEAWLAGPAPRPRRDRIDLGGRKRLRELARDLLLPIGSDEPLAVA